METDQLLKDLFPENEFRSLINRVKKDSVPKSWANSIDYTLHNSAGEVLQQVLKAACFGSLGTQLRTLLKEGKKPTHIRYKPIPYPKAKLSRVRQLRWIRLGFKRGVIPRGTGANKILDEGLLLNFSDPSWPITRVYCTLAFLRYIREAPSLVKNVIRLVDQGGRDFWAAFCFCHEKNCYAKGHSILNYHEGKNLATVLNLHHYFKDPASFDKRNILETIEGGPYAYLSWKMHETITPKVKVEVQDSLMLLSSEITPAIECGSIIAAAEAIKELKTKETTVKFV